MLGFERALAEIVEPLDSEKAEEEKAAILQARIVKHSDQWLVFIDDPRVPPTNNMPSERCVRW